MKGDAKVASKPPYLHFYSIMYFYDGAIAISPRSYEPAIPKTAFPVNSAFTGMLK